MPRVKLEDFFSNTQNDLHGIEIGALHSPYHNISHRIHIKYVDRMSVADLRKQYPELNAHHLITPDIIDDGETLQTIPDNSLDFVIANHFLEHCENLLRTIETHVKKVKKGGILYYYIPNKDFTFDKHRAMTTVDHILSEYHDGHEMNRRSHFEDWCQNVPGCKQTADEVMAINYSIHFHVWDYNRFTEIIALIQQVIPNVEVALHERNGDEICLILRKQ